MNSFLLIVLTNAVIATLLFLIVLAIGRVLRHPVILHWLLVLVLVKLISPPFWTLQLELLPLSPSGNFPAVAMTRDVAAPAVESTRAPSSPAPSGREHSSQVTTSRADPMHIDVSPGLAPAKAPASIARAAASPSFSSILVALWASGACFLIVLALWRIHRFQRAFQSLKPAPESIQELAHSLGAKLGLQCIPQIWLAPGQISPMLWAPLANAKIIVPGDLFEILNQPSRETLLLHELAHFRRGDHWLRRLELLVLTLYWWFPLAWIVCREIRRAEELACDAMVVSLRPSDRRAYAQMLVNTAAFMSGAGLPSLATGAISKLQIENRVEKIMRSAIQLPVSHPQRLLVCAVAILLLPLAPRLIQAQRSEKPIPNASATMQEAKISNAAADEATELTGTVIDEIGEPVPNILVTTYRHGHRIDRSLTTDELGHFRVPATWIGGVDGNSEAFFVVRKEETHIGWFDLVMLKLKRDRNQVKGAARNQFTIALLPRSVTIRGQLVDNTGKPLNDIQVAVESLFEKTNQSFSRYGMASDELLSTTTDRDGQFSIKIPRGAQGAFVPLHQDWQRTPKRFADSSTDLGQLALSQAGRIEGQVIEQSTGKPLIGQRIVCQTIDSNREIEGLVTYGAATTGADGKFIIGGLSPGRFNVLFSGASRGAALPPLTPVAVEGAEVAVNRPAIANFTAINGRKLSGLVVDAASGKPLTNVSVGYYGTARPTSGAGCIMVRTDREGKFEFRVPPGESKVYIAEGGLGRHDDASRTVEIPEDRDLTDFVLKAGPKEELGSFVGDVPVPMRAQEVDDANTPAAPEPYHLKVALIPPAGKKVNQATARTVFAESQYSHSWTLLTATNHEITFSDDHARHTAFLLIEAEGFAPLRSADFVVRERMPELKVDLKPEVRVPIRGRIVDTKGTAIEGARIRVARQVYGLEEEFPWGLEYTTQKSGAFEIKHVRQGDRIQLRIDNAPSSGAESEWIKVSGQEPIVLGDLVVGARNREIGGSVEDIDGFPVVDAKVIYAGDPRQETKTDEQGKFRLAGLPTGTVKLSIEPKELAKINPTVRTGKLDHRFMIGKRSPEDVAAYQVNVKLRPRDEKEIAEVSLFFAVEGGKILFWQPERHGASHQLSFADLARRNEGKNFVVIAAARGYALSKPVTVPNQRGPHAIEIDLEPAEPVTLRGRLIDEAGHPILGATVGLATNATETAKHNGWSPINSKAPPPLTDSEGRFEIKGILPNSRVAIYANKSGRSGAWSEAITITGPDDVVVPDLILSEATAEIAGIVRNDQGTPVENARVWIADLGTNVKTTTDAQGHFNLQKVPSPKRSGSSASGPKVLLRVSTETSLWSQYVAPNHKAIEVKLTPLPSGG